MANIKKITLPSGTTYDIVDQGARDLIDALESYSAYLGVTTTALTDGATTNPITIGGESVTAKNGNIVNYGSKEFIYNGTKWQEFGDLSALGDLAFKDSASGNFTPSGSVSQPTFTGTQKYLHLSTTKGTVTSTGNYTPSGSVTISTGTGEPNYTPSGTVSQPIFTGVESEVSLDALVGFLMDVTIFVNSTSEGAESNFTPSGTVSTPTITVTPSTTTIKNPTSVTVAKTVATAQPTATAPANQVTWCDVSDETLRLYKIGYTTGASITTSNVTVATGITSATSSQPTFTGDTCYTHMRRDYPTQQQASSMYARVTPQGTVSQPTFTGTGANLTGSFTGTQGSVSVSTTGAVTAVSGSVNTTSSGGIDIKPAGTVSKPTFTGTQGTVTVS